MAGPDIMQMLRALAPGAMSVAAPQGQPDPRLAAMAQMQGGTPNAAQQNAMPGETVTDPRIRQLQEATNQTMRTKDGYGHGTDDGDGPDREPDQDQDLIDMVHSSMGGGDKEAPKPEDVHPDQWPSSREGFKQMFGREPATDSEVEYYGPVRRGR